MVTNHLYPLFASLTGLDWTAADYANVGLQPDENEFLCRFIFRTWLTYWNPLKLNYEEFAPIDINFDKSRSFSTPIGLSQTFPLPRIPIPLDSFILTLTGVDLSPFVNLALEIGPNLGSDKVTAHWKAENGAVGEGELLWTTDNQKLTFNINTQNMVTTTKITLSEFRYWFTIFTVDFSLTADFQGILALVPRAEFHIYTLNLSDIIRSFDLSVGVHRYTVGTVLVNVLVIPEVLMGTVATILAMLGALGLHNQTKYFRKKRFWGSS